MIPPHEIAGMLLYPRVRTARIVPATIIAGRGGYCDIRVRCRFFAREVRVADEFVLVNCPSCRAKNRIPLGRIGQSGHCGRCHSTLSTDSFYSDTPVAVTDARFELLSRRSPLPVLVDFWAAWCHPCHQMEPIIDALARDLAGRLLVLKVDTEREVATAARFSVRGVPTLVVLRSGLEVDRIPGALPLPALRQRLERFL